MARQFQGMIFDIDGTLVDSNDAHAHAWVQALEEQGYQASFDEVRPLIGMGGDKVFPEVAGIQKDSAPAKKISQRRKSIFLTQYLPNLQAFPQAWELLQHLHQQGLTLATATSAEPDELQGLLKVIHPDAASLFAKETSAQDAQHSKPDPDIMHAALQQLQMQPEACLMFGDTAYDIEAAHKAKIQAIAFRCGGWSDKDLQGALAIYDGPADLLARYTQSPLAQ